MLETPDPAMFPGSAYPLRLSEGLEATGGVVEAFAAAGLTPLPCYLKLDATMPGYGGDAELALTRARLSFPRDPMIAKGDRLLCLQGGTRRTVRASGPTRAGDGWGALYLVDGEVTE